VGEIIITEIFINVKKKIGGGLIKKCSGAIPNQVEDKFIAQCSRRIYPARKQGVMKNGRTYICTDVGIRAARRSVYQG